MTATAQPPGKNRGGFAVFVWTILALIAATLGGWERIRGKNADLRLTCRIAQAAVYCGNVKRLMSHFRCSSRFQPTKFPSHRLNRGSPMIRENVKQLERLRSSDKKDVLAQVALCCYFSRSSWPRLPFSAIFVYRSGRLLALLPRGSASYAKPLWQLFPKRKSTTIYTTSPSDECSGLERALI
jgi:hypothetical protein